MVRADEGLPKGCAYWSESYASQAHRLGRQAQGNRGFHPRRQAPCGLAQALYTHSPRRTVPSGCTFCAVVWLRRFLILYTPRSCPDVLCASCDQTTIAHNKVAAGRGTEYRASESFAR